MLSFWLVTSCLASNVFGLEHARLNNMNMNVQNHIQQKLQLDLKSELSSLVDQESGLTSYDEATAQRDLYFAYGAYCSSSGLKAWNCKWCDYIPTFEIDTVVDVADFQAFTGYDPDKSQIVVSFRGSTNIPNWIDNIDYAMVAYPGVSNGYIHAGFYSGWNDFLRYGVESSVRSLTRAHSRASILVTGHSLGAALAAIAALDLKAYGSVHTSTYGEPRWGNDVMANYFAGRVSSNWRIVNVHDVVPTIPLQNMTKEGYHHTWTEVWYTNDSPLRHKVCDGSGEDPHCWYLERSVDDHLNYFNLPETCA